MDRRRQVLSFLEQTRLIAVIRIRDSAQLLPLCQALVEGGIRALEITLTVPNALQELSRIRPLLNDTIIGAGTVLDSATAREACHAGADFIVSPVTRPEIVQTAHEQDRVVMLGAYTPTEALLAHQSGADFVKIFPADSLGPGFIRALMAPMPYLKIVPTGGVDEKNAAEFLKAGSSLLGIGSALFSSTMLQEKNWKEISKRASSLAKVVSSIAS